MAGPKPALYASGITCMGFICLILACVTVFLPIWGNYEDRYGGYQAERGYFGPWKVCKKLNYNREFCSDTLRFRVSGEFVMQCSHGFFLMNSINIIFQVAFMLVAF